MRKNRTMRVAALLLALTLITSCFVGGTFAKYVRTGTGEGTATAAAWITNIELGNLTAAHQQATTSVTAAKLAPGTTGTITIPVTVTGTPDVAWKLTLTGSATATGAPDTLKFTLGDNEDMTFTQLSALLTSGYQVATGNAGVAPAVNNITIDWNWAFEGTGTAAEKTAVDTADTNFAGQSITFSLTLTAEQVQSVVTES